MSETNAPGTGENDSHPDETGPAARNRLLTLGAAAVMVVYAAGYDRTREGAQRFSADKARPHAPHTTKDSHSAPVPTFEPAATAQLSQRKAATQPPADRRHPATTALAGGDTARAVVADAPATPTPAPTRNDVAVAMAPAPTLASSASTPADTAKADVVARLKDGTYSGWGTSRHGDIEASIVITNGHIVSASITQCLTRYSCSWISPLPPQVVARQSAEVDSVSGATQSSNAFYTAIFEALKLAK